METVTIPKESFVEVMETIENFIEELELVTSETVQKRLREIKENPTIGKNEQELDEYLKELGVKVG